MTRPFETRSNVVVLERPRRSQPMRVQPPRVEADPRLPEKSLWSVFCAYYTRARDRRTLADLDDHTLRDIGLSRDQVGRPFWEPLERS